MDSSAAAARPKPLLRGVSHQFAFLAAVVAAIDLVLVAPSGLPSLAAAIYGASLAALLGVSALYHRPTWAPRIRAFLGQLDHSAIFLLVAGTYTPICLIAMAQRGHVLLAIVWAGAAFGMGLTLLWRRMPKAVAAGIYVALGWTAVLSLPRLAAAMGWPALLGMLGGGALYTAGAVIYALRRPDPFPRVFGYHEIFHLLVVVAAAMHFVIVRRIVVGG